MTEQYTLLPHRFYIHKAYPASQNLFDGPFFFCCCFFPPPLKTDLSSLVAKMEPLTLSYFRRGKHPFNQQRQGKARLIHMWSSQTKKIIITKIKLMNSSNLTQNTICACTTHTVTRILAELSIFPALCKVRQVLKRFLCELQTVQLSTCQSP